MSKKRTILVCILGVIGIGIAVCIFAFSSYIKQFDSKVAAVTITNVDLSSIPDGTYNGSYDLFPVSVEVRVTVKYHTITVIDIIKHVNGQGTPAEVLTQKVIEAQSLYVDAVSGATASSKAILKAIEIALKSAK